MFIVSRLFAGTPFDIPPRCELCGQEEDSCQCEPAALAAHRAESARAAAFRPPSSQSARVRREQRKAKRVVTVIDGLSAEANDLPALCSKLQNCCGAGGTLRRDPDRIELQGDQTATVTEMLKQLGYRIRKK